MMKTIFVLLLCATLSTALQFAVMGDFGTGGKREAAATEMRSAAMFNEVCARLKCNFSITVGDNIYVQDVMTGMAESFEEMYDAPMKFFASVGNHDNQGPQIAYTSRSPRWHLPSPTYTVVLPIDNSGYTVQLFAIDSNHGAWMGWLTEELKRSTSRWKLIYGHHPATGSGRHGRMGTVAPLHELMKTYNAQVYFAGHDHILEYSINQGRANVVTGAMSRGGMMTRARGGSARKWTLTAPSEHNQFPLDWPYHGFMTCDLSPNVMTLSFWSQNGGVQYETVLTHDWIQKYNQHPNNDYSEPPPEVVYKAMMEEKTLPRGPGGGRAYGPTGASQEVPKNAASPPRPTSNNTVPVVATDPPRTYAPTPSTSGPVAHTAPPPPTVSPARYAVSTECDTCIGPTVNHPFTLFLDGAQVGPACRVFLTISSDGCDKVGTSGAHLLDGTAIATLTEYTATFVATGAANQPIYVCYSADSGKSYRRLRRVGSDEKTFQLYAATVTNAPAPANAGIPIPTGAAPQNVIQGDAPIATVLTASAASDAASPIPIIFLGVAVVGIAVVWLRRPKN